MLRRNRTQANSFIAFLVVAVALSAPAIARAQPNPQKDIERVIQKPASHFCRIVL